ncbi:MAG: class I adenylate-forming enzyme family protein, partial [Afipia sp.]
DHDDFLIIYTSGTTGKQKAIVLSQHSVVTGAESLAQMWGITESDITLVALPLGYLYGLSTAAAATLQAGGTVFLLRRFHPRLVLEGLIESGATVFHGVPTMFSMMLEYTEQRELSFDLGGLRRVICAGAPLPLTMLERFESRFGSRLENYYAMTEVTPVFGQLATSDLPQPAGSAGSLAPGAAARIIRPDGSECDEGEQGELLVHAPQTMSRYWNDPELTATSFQDGYFRSGDLGRRDANGFFYITGRMKDIIIRGGANISPSEVEHVLAGHHAVQDVAVIGVDDRIYGEVPVAFVVLRPGAAATQDELEQYGERRLADFKVPRRIIFDTALPVGKTGKVDKAVLGRRFADLAVTGD